jgi:hypothetical protein
VDVIVIQLQGPDPFRACAGFYPYNCASDSVTDSSLLCTAEVTKKEHPVTCVCLKTGSSRRTETAASGGQAFLAAFTLVY